MNNKPLVWNLILIFALLAIVNIIGSWNEHDHPRAQQGVLDLRGWSEYGHDVIGLNGEWAYYPGVLLTGANDAEQVPNTRLYYVPGELQHSLSTFFRGTAIGYGTYRLQVKLDREAGLQAFHVQLIRNAHRLYVNGELIGSSGETAETADHYRGEVKPYVAYKDIQSDTFEVFVQVANFDHSTSGGMIQAIQLGPPDLVNQERQLTVAMEFGVIVLFGFFALFFGVIHFQDKSNGWIYLSVFFCCTIGVMMLQGSRLILKIWPGLPLQVFITSHWICTIGIIVGMFMFVCSRYETRFYAQVKNSLLISSGVIALCVLLLPLPISTRLLPVWVVVVCCEYCYVLFVLIRGLQRRDRQSVYEFWAFCLFLALAILNLMRLFGLSESDTWYFSQVIGFSVSISMLIFLQFFQVYQNTKTLSLELKRMDQFNNEYMSGISEQIRTPLHSMISIANARLHADDGMTPEQTHDWRLITAVGWTTGNMAADLHDFSRIREQQIRLQLRPVHVYAVLDEVIERLAYMSLNGEVRLVNGIDPTTPSILADEQRLNQIFTSLLRYALQVTRSGTIVVEAAPTEQSVEVRIHMQGSGMTKDARARLARSLNNDPFTHPVILASGGFGLYLVHALVTLHKGHVNVRSDSSGGVTVLLAFPVALDIQVGPIHPVSKPSDPYEGDTRSLALTQEKGPYVADILLVDDDDLNVKVILTLLTLDHYRVTVVRDGREALRMAQQMQHVDLVIVDRTLPELSGLDVCRRIREKFSLYELPILLLTSAGYPDHAIAASEAGANDFLTKPVEASELRVRVRTLLQMKRSVTERIRMELAFLQAQIKPHFLFNTLNSIAALSKRQPEQMTELLVEFGHYLQESFRFDNSEPLIAFERELRLVKSFLHIEKVRFEDWLTFDLDISVEQFQLPPLTIQPLVENAVRHGIMARADGGHVQLRVWQEERHIWIAVKDNGVGMSAETLARVRSIQSSGGIGIPNIEGRLNQLFGHGLTIRSEPGQGTEIQFKLPIEKVGFHERYTG